jgi:polygalacturonase
MRYIIVLCVLSLGDCAFDVTSFGAVGDGVTDDTKSIVKALAAATAAGPSVVLFPGRGDAERSLV